MTAGAAVRRPRRALCATSVILLTSGRKDGTLSAGASIRALCATTTTCSACRRTRAPTRSSGRTGSWRAATIPTSRETTAAARSSSSRARTTCCAIRCAAAATIAGLVQPGRPRGEPGADWFSDEIAIDFPSVSSVLDRMRDAFFGAELPVTLSAADGAHPAGSVLGTSVPLDVPLRRTCPRLRRPRRDLDRVVRRLRRRGRGRRRAFDSGCRCRPAFARARGSGSASRPRVRRRPSSRSASASAEARHDFDPSGSRDGSSVARPVRWPLTVRCHRISICCPSCSASGAHGRAARRVDADARCRRRRHRLDDGRR